MTLFDDAAAAAQRSVAPLAVRMRPRTLDEVVGQQQLRAPGTPLRRMVENPDAGGSSVFLWGPPGTGKTTLAHVVSHATSRRFVELSAVNAGVKDVREAIDDARRELGMSGRQTVLFIDEVHRFSKTQQDALLPAVENRLVTLIAATTENPFFSVISPLLSRSLLLTLQPLTRRRHPRGGRARPYRRARAARRVHARRRRRGAADPHGRWRRQASADLSRSGRRRRTERQGDHHRRPGDCCRPGGGALRPRR